MAKSTCISVRVDEEDKNKAMAVLDELGMSMGTAITLYLKKIALTHGIPFEVTTDTKKVSSQYKNEK